MIILRPLSFFQVFFRESGELLVGLLVELLPQFGGARTRDSKKFQY